MATITISIPDTEVAFDLHDVASINSVSESLTCNITITLSDTNRVGTVSLKGTGVTALQTTLDATDFSSWVNLVALAELKAISLDLIVDNFELNADHAWYDDTASVTYADGSTEVYFRFLKYDITIS